MTSESTPLPTTRCPSRTVKEWPCRVCAFQPQIGLRYRLCGNRLPDRLDRVLLNRPARARQGFRKTRPGLVYTKRPSVGGALERLLHRRLRRPRTAFLTREYENDHEWDGEGCGALHPLVLSRPGDCVGPSFAPANNGLAQARRTPANSGLCERMERVRLGQRQGARPGRKGSARLRVQVGRRLRVGLWRSAGDSEPDFGVPCSLRRGVEAGRASRGDE